ncbi:MAG: hypothetical protein JST59_18410, partial [Actinobacteria bacterium]|nr:hypothetical protein [Actinomycetota bacterium]
MPGGGQPCAAWPKSKAGVEFKVKGEADTWLVDVVCNNGQGIEWGVIDGRPYCYRRRYHLNRDKIVIGTTHHPDLRP